MSNEKNLELGRDTQFRSGEEAARNGQKGGIASGVARRRKRSLKEAADLYLSLPVTDRRQANKIARRGVDLEDVDNQMAMIIGLVEAATDGDSRAAKVIVDMIGEDAGADTSQNALDTFLKAMKPTDEDLEALYAEEKE